MQQYNIHQAKTHLSRLVEEAANGKSFVITKAGKPLVKVMSIDAPVGKPMRRLGFMLHAFHIPDDFDSMGSTEIETL
ncbi:MAG: type II toxin-antitoxin system prevent-host-death family antitoxin [Gammaproteobacteria bacterium]|nr:type II toxin-antitoxin system prevent-host-death family antitoxin [Gammaproteobacteria bacterium]